MKNCSKCCLESKRRIRYTLFVDDQLLKGGDEVRHLSFHFPRQMLLHVGLDLPVRLRAQPLRN